MVEAKPGEILRDPATGKTLNVCWQCGAVWPWGAWTGPSFCNTGTCEETWRAAHDDGAPPSDENE
jgi:hypothetical protein